MIRKRNTFKYLDWFTLILYALLVFAGWFNIYSASYNVDAPSIFDLSQEYGKQFIWIITAGVLGAVIMLFDGDFIKRSSPIVYLVTTALLFLVLIFGKEVNGAKSWFGFGSFGIQPSEFAKLGTSLMLAFYLSQTNIKIKQFKTKAYAVLIILVPALFILLQPDTGTVLVFAAYIVQVQFGLIFKVFVFFGLAEIHLVQ